jgi:hypothetical protein
MKSVEPTRYEALVATLRAEFPKFRILRKDQSRGQGAIDQALIVLTLGQMRSYLNSFETTIGSTVYVTPDWEELDEDRRYVLLRHEAMHLKQFRAYTLPGMALLDLLLPLPIGLSWFRAHFENTSQLLGLRNAVRHGMARAMFAVLGRLGAFAVFIGMIVIGLGAMLTTSIEAFTVIKWAGVGYLAWTGVTTLRNSSRDSELTWSSSRWQQGGWSARSSSLPSPTQRRCCCSPRYCRSLPASVGRRWARNSPFSARPIY